MIQLYKVNIMALLKIRTSDDKTNEIIKKIGMDNCVRVKSIRYANGIQVPLEHELYIN